MRRFEFVVGDDDHGDVVTRFDLGKLLALLVDEEVGNGRWCLHEHLARAVLHRMLLDQSQGRQRQRFDAADAPVAVATRTDDLGRFTERRAQALA
jgi:hypothetical protein